MKLPGTNFCSRARRARGLLLFFLLAWSPHRAAGNVVINEVMTSNGSVIADENGDFPDWIELFNPGSDPFDLTGCGLSDDAKAPFKWIFQNAALASHDFLLVFASGKDRQPPAAPSAGPPPLDGLKAWFSADTVDLNDGAQARPANGRFWVRQWRDQSGHGNTATQTGFQGQPEWIDGGPAERNVKALRFDGVDDWLALPSSPGTNDFCLIAVVRPSISHEIDQESAAGVGGVSGQRYLFGASHGGDAGAGAGVSAGTNGISVYEHGSGYMPALAVYRGPVGPGWVITAVNYAGRQPAIYLDGALSRLGLRSSRALVAAPVQIGAGAYGAFRGDIAEILIYSRALSETEREAVEQSLAAKYRIQLARRFHTNFSLNSAGERVLLTAPDGRTLDELEPVMVPRDFSFGRQPDGGPDRLFFQTATPGASNAARGYRELVAAPVFSHPGGFYSNAIELALTVTNEGAIIRYTVDGSDPGESSLLYTNALLPGTLAQRLNVLSMIPTAAGWQAPIGQVFKGTVVRARAFKEGALPSATVTHTFWVTPRGPARYSMPVASLSTHRNNFFDARIGIYVAGNAAGGNFSQRGPDWERPVHVEFFETDGRCVFSQDASVKIHGNTSQNFPIKGLDLNGRGGLGRQPFRHQVFPARGRTEFGHLLLRPSGHDYSLAIMRDELMQSLVEEWGVETQAARAAVVFLNGEYWGIHYLKEKEDDDFISFYGGVAPGGFDFLEGYAAAKAGDTAQYDALLNFLQTHALTSAMDYARVESLMEVPNYIDYKAAEIFNYRWDIGNHRLWRPRAPGGRWRWLQFDNDVGWGGFWAEQPAAQFDMLQADTEPTRSLHDHNTETTTFLLRKLLTNDLFRAQFVNRFADLLNTTFDPARTVARVNALAGVLEPEMPEHINRWRAPASLAAWKGNVQYLRAYATARPGFVRQHLARKFGLRGTARLSVAVSNPNAGSIKVNTLEMDRGTNAAWTGLYFRDNGLPVAALPKPGYRFAGWSGILGVATNSFTLLLNGDLALTAWFEPDPQMAPVVRGIGREGEGLVRLEFGGLFDRAYGVQGSSNFFDWTTIENVTAPQGGLFEVIQTASERMRFFRLIMLDGNP